MREERAGERKKTGAIVACLNLCIEITGFFFLQGKGGLLPLYSLEQRALHAILLDHFDFKVVLSAAHSVSVKQQRSDDVVSVFPPESHIHILCIVVCCIFQDFFSSSQEENELLVEKMVVQQFIPFIEL